MPLYSTTEFIICHLSHSQSANYFFVSVRFDVGKSEKMVRLFQRHSKIIQVQSWIAAGMM